MTTVALPTKRARRRRGPERKGHAEVEMAAWLAQWETTHRIASALPHWQPGDVGRPPLYPPALFLIFDAMCSRWGGERSTERQLKDDATWEAIRRPLFARYPEYQRLRPGAPPPKKTRWAFRRYRDTYCTKPEISDALFEAFRAESASQALAVGVFDIANRSFTHPPESNFVAGDSTILKSRFKAVRGAKQKDPETGELVEMLYDPDAVEYKKRNEFGEPINETVYGTSFGLIHARLPHEAEQIILDIFHVTSGDNAEGVSVERAVERLQHRAPGLMGIVYDMALRGKNRDHLYDLGLLAITKVPKTKRGKPRLRSLGPQALRTPDNGIQQKEVVAVDGAPSISVIASGKQNYVRLERVRLQRARAKGRSDASRPYRWYGHYRVPNDPRVEPRLRGAALTIRLNDPNAPFSLADSLHAIAPGEDDWERLFDLRNPTESLNALIKRKFESPKQRAPAVGAARQQFALLGAALYLNLQAEIAHSERVGRAAA